MFFPTYNCTLQFHGISYLTISEQFAITISKTLPPSIASASEITLNKDKIMLLKGCSLRNPCSRLIHFWIPLQILVDFAWEW